VCNGDDSGWCDSSVGCCVCYGGDAGVVVDIVTGVYAVVGVTVDVGVVVVYDDGVDVDIYAVVDYGDDDNSDDGCSGNRYVGIADHGVYVSAVSVHTVMNVVVYDADGGDVNGYEYAGGYTDTVVDGSGDVTLMAMMLLLLLWLRMSTVMLGDWVMFGMR